ncbi:hypothetical protein, partial [Mesorhizobium sp. M6A.T.Cr.TU.017.01.1.1]|uniref:hypothetical protein n=1 Tax=Mesorhizobium sp. M6A.T.Cr.TU.017.01.1.1 TaxID=2496774 RepID=UPI0019D4B6BE
ENHAGSGQKQIGDHQGQPRHPGIIGRPPRKSGTSDRYRFLDIAHRPSRQLSKQLKIQKSATNAHAKPLKSVDDPV